MHSGPFGCLTKLGEKRADLVQKFVPRSRVGIFRNECTRSTPLAPKLMFWCVSFHWVHSGPFGCLTKIGAKRAELVQKFVPRSRGGIFRNQRTRSTPLNPKHQFRVQWGGSGAVLVRFILFWMHSEPFGCLTKLGAIRAELVQKFVARSRSGIFRNQHT